MLKRAFPLNELKARRSLPKYTLTCYKLTTYLLITTNIQLQI